MDFDEARAAQKDYEATSIDRQVAIESLVCDYELVAQKNLPIIDQLKAVIRDLEAPLKKIRSSLSEMMEPGEKVETPYTLVQMRKGYMRTSWETKSLEGFAVDHPEILQWRKVKEVAPSLAIKHKG